MAHADSLSRACATIPATAGIGLRSPHGREIAETRPAIGWFEVHSENYFGRGGAPLRTLERIRADYPLSLHGVGMSLGSVDETHADHLDRLKDLIARIEPGLVSEHLSWSSYGGTFLNDLLPLPYTEEALEHLVARIQRVQETLGLRILIENPSSYLEYRHSTLPEAEFLVEAARRSGCGILLDVNNVYVSCRNHGWSALDYLRAIPQDLVEELHLAGHTVNRLGDRQILIDTHDRPVCAAVWQLFGKTLDLIGPRPTLIEWDTDLPDLQTLLTEADRAGAFLEVRHVRAA
ncbi:DUF692 domain-containing protein [Methylococcus sp. EFPC2]|uniref:MNIO family bufferin maturase n=1 Tax=Methylococcus sp. EFPC2 TaxID=2812648 RepID=UPI0019671488|nr:DUF692 domain-containing protein [Methylococcus sp. EFPC2]QSA95773.1 DUF692 domain-containing protein [Methylococcus sp. EFPC2]